ncbi:MAG: peptide chain release factor N(5)-glutamine methyltransferase, partial [Actinomycetota bacterium]
MAQTIGSVLSEVGSLLTGSVSNPAREAEILLGTAVVRPRADLYRDLDCTVDSTEYARIMEAARRRAAMEPLQYITGVQGFRGLELAVGPGVLVPRPETEIVVERCLKLLEGLNGPTVADLGTGSGAIALAIAAERADARVWATELSADAMVWARRNLARCRASNVMLRSGDLFGPLPARLRGRFDLVVSNPPYLSEQEFREVPVDVAKEPEEALVAGPTGLEVSAQIVDLAPNWLRPAGWLVLETSPLQLERLRTLMEKEFLRVAVTED